MDTSSSPTPKITVAVLEDGRHAQIGIVLELEAAEDIKVVLASRDPDEIIALVKKEPPDIAFIDLKIGGDIKVGIEVIEQIKEIEPQVKCIVLTAFPNLERFVRALDAGADGFIRKDVPEDRQPKLTEICRHTKAGGRHYDPELVEQMRLYLDEDRLPFTELYQKTSNLRNPLSSREREILPLLQKRYSNQEIAEALSISIHTVKTHISNICSKLGAQDRHEIVFIAISKNLLRDPDVNND